MARRGENIYKRKDGRYEGRYIKYYDISGKAVYGYVYSRSYAEVKELLAKRKTEKPEKQKRIVFRMAQFVAEIAGCIKTYNKASL